VTNQFAINKSDPIYLAQSLYEKFLYNSGEIEIMDVQILVKMKKKRNLPALLSAMDKFKDLRIPWLNDKKCVFLGASTT
jgi:hypothetical protein